MRLEERRVALHPALYRRRHGQLRDRVVDGRLRLAEAHAGLELEPDAFRGELAPVLHAVFGGRVLVPAEGRQRHALAVGDDVQPIQRLGALGVLGRDLHHDAVLVERVVDGRHLSLTERVVERLRHRGHLHTQSARLVTVHVQRDLLARDQVVVHPSQFRQRRQCFLHAIGPYPQQPGVVGQQHVLVSAAAASAAPAAAEADVLVDEQPHPRARHVRQVAVDALHDLLRADLALAQRLETHEGLRVVDPAAAADEARHALDRRVFQHRTTEFPNLRLHHLERQAVVAADEAAQLAGVLVGQEALGRRDVERDVERHHAQQEAHHQRRVPQRPAQRRVVAAQQPPVGPCR